jgi:negative regulator of genetic competence, sporulation and motility
MSIFDELEAQYYDIDNEFSSIEFEAMSKGWGKKQAKYQRRRKLNDQAYFLFMFSRLEDIIRYQSSALITKKQTSISSWKQRAAWDILPNRACDEMPFKKRLALLTEKGHRDYNLIVDYYKERNSIAHGGTFTSVICMPTVISELKRLCIAVRK